MPLGHWLKNWTAGDQPAPKNEKVVVAESLLMELDFQMRETENVTREQEKEDQRLRGGGVDYSWLVSSQPKPYEMPQLERLELEELCLKVKPDESGRVITLFRDALIREPSVHEVPRIMRAVILQVLEGRPKDDTMSEWLMKSLTKLKPSTHTKVMPVGGPGEDCSSDAEGQNGSSNIFTVDQLPV